ncbi:MAG: YajQ family cyclic di-GMP-binding protein [Candidatus Zixiibacteriota bacterium]
MAQKLSFDVVSKIDLQEALNAVNQALREVSQRYDLKSSKTTITLNQAEHNIVIATADDFKLKSVVDILEARMVKRGVPLKALTFNKPEEASGGTVRQKIDIQSGISVDKCKEIVKLIKGAKLKVQSTIQDAQVRVTGPKKDDLQEVQRLLKESSLDIHMEFDNYR